MLRLSAAAVASAGALMFLGSAISSADTNHGTTAGSARPSTSAANSPRATVPRLHRAGPAAPARRTTLTTKAIETRKPAAAGRSARSATEASSTPSVDTSKADVPYTNWAADQQLFTGRPSLLNRLFNLVLWGLEQVSTHATLMPAPTVFNQESPPWYSTVGLTVSRADVNGMPVYTLAPPTPSGDYVVALHGGGYVSQPLVFEWLANGAIARQTGATVVVPMYPLAGQGGTAATVVPAVADLLSALVDVHGADHVSLTGASAGGGLALAATQELVRRGAATPGRIVLISPWLDASVSDPASGLIWDPLLDVRQLQTFGLAWANGLDLTDPRASPLYGSLDGLPPIAVYSGSRDLLAPDTLRLRQRAITQGLDMTFVLRDGQFHGWPLFLPLPDAVSSLRTIEQQLGIAATGATHTGHGPGRDELRITCPTGPWFATVRREESERS
ncbi:hypothetical protein MANY_01080 [Mycolicibacterium anyangense]|uniref:Alpha/beta hydrolase fold-3 domain-containing protein n=1 Tax=Mycolicibacterium anyangense TaxID=1431246 RepID=A0A6N4W5P7_9MYCO|nr:hypothetical protein MANY_01080 [Mycolicibacterium anyangense]